MFKLYFLICTDDAQLAAVLSNVSDTIDSDWVTLAHQLAMPEKDILKIQLNHPYPKEQAFAALHLWSQRTSSSKDELERSLKRIGRSDIVRKCLYNIEVSQVTSKKEEIARLSRTEAPDGMLNLPIFLYV